MPRWILLLALLPYALAQDQPKPPQKRLDTQRTKPQPGAKEEVPPEEDRALANQQYSFNPLQSVKDVGVGDQYFKNRRYRAAELRYTSATKWNDANAEAWLKLGEVEERLKESQKARQAYQKYLDLAADGKRASEIRKRLEKLK